MARSSYLKTRRLQTEWIRRGRRWGRRAGEAGGVGAGGGRRPVMLSATARRRLEGLGSQIGAEVRACEISQKRKEKL